MEMLMCGCVTILTLFVDNEFWISYNFHVIRYSSSSDFFLQSFESIKIILSSQAIETQRVGWIWAVGQSSPTPVLQGTHSAWGEIIGRRSLMCFLLKIWRWGVEKHGLIVFNPLLSDFGPWQGGVVNSPFMWAKISDTAKRIYHPTRLWNVLESSHGDSKEFM